MLLQFALEVVQVCTCVFAALVPAFRVVDTLGFDRLLALTVMLAVLKVDLTLTVFLVQCL